MKQLSSMMTGPACSGSSTPPMPAPPEMWQFLPICAQDADRGPGVDHGALVDVGAEVDERGQQHDAGRDVGGAAHDAAGDGAEAGAAEIVGGHAGELGGHLVPPRGPARGAGNRHHVVQAERQQHGLLEPLIDGPAVRTLLGDAHLALVQQVERLLDRVADDAGRAGRNALALFPHRLDRALQLGGVHVLRHRAPRFFILLLTARLVARAQNAVNANDFFCRTRQLDTSR